MKFYLKLSTLLIVLSMITTVSIAQENYLRKATILELPIIQNFSGLANSTVAADFDNDGDMDMAYVFANVGSVGWYKNNGNQTYIQSIILTDAEANAELTAEDLDMDGDIDIIIGGHLGLGTQLRWLINDGLGNFTLDTISTTTRHHHWEVTDLDSDGDMDIISVRSAAGQTLWYENDGSENFTEHLISTSATNPIMIRAVDMDNDGDMDAVVCSRIDNKVVWYENDGSESFTANNISTTDNGVNSVAVADFEGDGDIDVFTTSNAVITWYKNNGSQVFSTNVIINDNLIDNIHLSDLDNDGDLDIITSLDGVKWYENDNNKSFTKRILVCCITNGIDFAHAMDIADMDNDGDLDILTAAINHSPNNDFVQGLIWIEMDTMMASTSPMTNSPNISSSANLTFNFNSAIDGSTLTTDNIIVTGDQSGKINGSFSGGGTSTIVFNPTNNFHKGEVVHVNISSGLKTLEGYNLLGQHAYDFRTAADPYGFIPSTYTKQIVSDSAIGNRTNFPVDMDGDGDIDVLSHSGTELVWLKNDGSQNFTELSISISVDDSYLIYAVDLDLDGDMDAISISQNNHTTRWFENDGSENFTEFILPTALGANNAAGLQPADFDGDGDIDIFVSFVLTGHMVLYENDGSQNFTLNVRDTVLGAHSGRAVDMDLDGDMDILSAINGTNLVWYENDSRLSGIEHPIGIAPENISSFYPVDMDADGDIDIVAGTSSSLIWYQNDGNQNFTQFLIESGNYTFGYIDAMDMDADGDIDIVVASGFGDSLFWFSNDGSQNFIKHSIDALNNSHSVFAIDMDNDGDMDVLSSSAVNNEVVWYEFGCTAPDIPTLTASNSPCPGSTTTINIAGNLNDATVWDVFTGSCGGTLIGSTATASFDVNPTVNTTYYIRGNSTCGAQTCSSVTVNVSADVIAPTITCPGSLTINASPTVCTFAIASMPPSSVSDNCGTPTVTWNLTGATTTSGAGNFGGLQLNVGLNTITYYATDLSGNVDSCSFTIQVNDTEAPNVVCQNINAFLDAAGNATIVAADIDGGSTDNCSVVTFSASQTAFTCADLGLNNVTLTVTDASGNSSNCVAVVTIVDTIAPSITCPANQIVNASPSVCTFFIGSVLPTSVSDNCGATTVNWTMIGATTGFGTGTFASTNLNVGISTVTYHATDASGNTDSCSFLVEVVDATAPITVCQNINVYLDATGNATIAAADIDGGSTDNCSGLTLSASITTFTCADLGANNVTLTATDGNSNAANCVAVVTVLDTLLPTITCPANIVACVGDVITFATPTGADNCSQTVTQTDATGLSSGMVFPSGITTIEFTSTDGSGNTGVCTFTVDVSAVIDTSVTDASPVLTANQNGATYQWLDCDNGNAIISGETNQSFTATVNGNYAVEITMGSCVDTSACKNVISIGIDEVNALNNVIIYPNPTNNFITIDISKLKSVARIVLTDTRGRVVYQSSKITEHIIKVDLSNYSKGIYMLLVESNTESKVYKVIRD